VSGVPAETRRARTKVRERLFHLFDGNDPDEELRRVKSEDAGF
jgi:hypothetical protein